MAPMVIYSPSYAYTSREILVFGCFDGVVHFKFILVNANSLDLKSFCASIGK